MISVRHEVFMEVASNLSFSKAAQVLFISQPAISKHIKALEAQYGTTLIERNGNTIELTKAGRLLYDRLSDAKMIQSQLEFDLSTMKNTFHAKGQLKLGASTTVALYIIPKILSRFHQKYPDIKISLLNRNTDTIVKALLAHEINVGIVEGKNKISRILYQPYITDEVVAVCSTKSSIAKKAFLTIQEMKKYPIALREQGSGTLEALKYVLQKKFGIRISDLNVGVRMAGTEALKNFLKEDDCLGFLPKRSILREIRDGELVEVKIDKLIIMRDFFFIQRQGMIHEGLNKVFINFAKLDHN